jgi:hypothetical protein
MSSRSPLSDGDRFIRRVEKIRYAVYEWPHQISIYRISQSLAAASLLFVLAMSPNIMSVARNDGGGIDGRKPIKWLFAGFAATAIAANPDIAHFLENSRPFVIGRTRIPGVPPSWDAVQIVSFKSLAAIRSALKTGGLPPEVRAVMYDYEKWRFTPEEEQRDPGTYLKQAADLVHAQNLLFFTAPAVNLVTVLAAGEDPALSDETYLKLKIAADAARFADVFDIQAQRFEFDTERYANFVRRAAAQAREANPKVIVLAGISTQPYGPPVTAEIIFRAITATREIVDGYWFNVPRPSQYSPHATEFRPDIAIDVLRRLAGQ